jgi:phosphopantetheinyl transferase
VDPSPGIIWRTCPIHASPSADLWSWLTRKDLLDGAGISHPQARTRSLVARALLRRTIAEARPDLERTVLDIRATRSGRPVVVVGGPSPDPTLAPDLDPTLEDDLGLSLAVSHTRGLAAVAVSTVGPVGIDVEPLGRDDLPPAGIWLTPEEQLEHDGLPPQQQRALLLRLWVAKEAALKACDATSTLPRSELGVRSSGELHRVPNPEEETGTPPIGQVVWHEIEARFLLAITSSVTRRGARGVVAGARPRHDHDRPGPRG